MLFPDVPYESGLFFIEKLSYNISMIKVLYEDNHIIAVYKPSGVLTQGDRSGDQCLMDDVKKYLREKYERMTGRPSHFTPYGLDPSSLINPNEIAEDNANG